MVSIGTLFSDFMQLVGLNHYTKTQSDNQYAAKDHSHTGYLTSHQDISGKLDKAQGSSKASKNVVTDSNGNITTEDKPTIPSASSTTPSADTTNGSVGSGTTWAKADHTHPKSTLYAEASHTHSNYVNPTIVDNLTTNDSTKVLSAKQGKVLQDNKLEKTHASYKGKNVVTNASTGAIEFEDKPTIPSKTSDLTNDSGFLTSHQDISGKIDTAGSGLSKSGTTLNHSNSITAVTTAAFKKIKYDAQGHITGTADVAASDLPSHTHSQYALSTDIPSSTSDLTNDGEDGINPFVSDDDSRLSDARTPTSHTHGNLTNDGKVGSTANYFVYTTTSGAITSKQKIGNITTSGAIGSTANKPLITTTSGVITTGSFGTAANTFCAGNDSRLHTHTFTYSNGTLTIS